MADVLIKINYLYLASVTAANKFCALSAWPQRLINLSGFDTFPRTCRKWFVGASQFATDKATMHL